MRRRAAGWLAVAVSFVAIVAVAQSRAAAQNGEPILVLLSFDGWRWDYTDRFDVPNLRGLAARGVRVRELIPSFPALTFPNHYTLVTGLYPEHHGIVANVMCGVSVVSSVSCAMVWTAFTSALPSPAGITNRGLSAMGQSTIHNPQSTIRNRQSAIGK